MTKKKYQISPASYWICWCHWSHFREISGYCCPISSTQKQVWWPLSWYFLSYFNINIWGKLRKQVFSVLITFKPWGFQLLKPFLHYQPWKLAFRKNFENQLFLSLIIVNWKKNFKKSLIQRCFHKIHWWY